MATGLYDPAYEHDACGVGMVADLNGRPDHDIVDRGLTVLELLAHRGASGAEVNTGDGAGILVQIPHRFLVGAAEAAGFTLPERGGYAVGLVFLPTDPDDALKARTVVEHTATEEGLTVLGWRTVPTERRDLGQIAKGAMPLIQQLFVAPAGPGVDTMALERRAFVLRKRAEHAVDDLYFPSLSPAHRLQRACSPRAAAAVLPDLRAHLEVGLALVHSRFSTNTFPAGRWPAVPLPLPRGGSARWPATATGCAREALLGRRSLRTCRASADLHPGGGDSASSTRCSVAASRRTRCPPC